MAKIAKYISFGLVFSLCSVALLHSEDFRFRYTKGDRYRIMSQVDEQVFINGLYSHSADILNKIAIEVSDVRDDAGYLVATFQTSERSHNSDSVYEWAREYDSEFWRDGLGAYDIAPRYYMPVVRSVPLFPGREMQIGETWSAPGEEVHDLRDNFGVSDAFRFPIQVGYRYEGKSELDGRMLDLILLEYTVFYRPGRAYNADMYPVRIAGYSRQRLYWDPAEGKPYHYNEEFDFVFDFNTGDSVEYVGTAEATVHLMERMNREEVADNIEKQLADVDDTSVRVSEEGVTVSMENIQFKADSALLLEVEREKIRLIGKIIAQFPNRDILITGHTALAGTPAGRKMLSVERAKAVGNYLLELGYKSADQITIKGVGAMEPIGDNSTEEGMRRNRRVEITILEN